MRGGIWQAVARRPPRGTIVSSASTASTTMIATTDYRALLDTAIIEARTGLYEGGIPIGAAPYHQDGRQLGCGHTPPVQALDPPVHGQTDAYPHAAPPPPYPTTHTVP